MAGSVSLIVDLVKAALDETPPEVVADLMEQGIALAGGGALLQGLAQRLSEEVKVRVWVAPDPLTAVAIGCGSLLENLDTLRAILQSSRSQPPPRDCAVGIDQSASVRQTLNLEVGRFAAGWSSIPIASV